VETEAIQSLMMEIMLQQGSKSANSFLISIYTTTSAFMGISDISSFKPATATINSAPAKHQISAFSSCFPQLLSHSPPATAASQQQQPKQTDPKKRSSAQQKPTHAISKKKKPTHAHRHMLL
jgi:hypothetical protein